nr:MAG TPA: Protein of unknown function (DUF1642) [Caudoviricetes sp.]
MNKKELIKYFEDLPYISITQMGKKSFIDLIEQLEEPQKVVVPQFIADWIETAKNIYSFSGGMFHGGPVVNKWLDSEDNQRTFALAWFDGYIIEEKRYRVKMKAIKSNSQYLVFGQLSETWWFGYAEQIGNVKSEHTHKEIEDAGFGEVFNSPLFEVEEVE